MQSNAWTSFLLCLAISSSRLTKTPTKQSVFVFWWMQWAAQEQHIDHIQYISIQSPQPPTVQESLERATSTAASLCGEKSFPQSKFNPWFPQSKRASLTFNTFCNPPVNLCLCILHWQNRTSSSASSLDVKRDLPLLWFGDDPTVRFSQRTPTVVQRTSQSSWKAAMMYSESSAQLLVLSIYLSVYLSQWEKRIPLF